MNTTLPEKSKTPLTEDQHRFLQQLLATLSPEQSGWVAGYLTALAGVGAQAGGGVPASGTADITILVGSQTGNCERLSKQFHQLAGARGLRTAIKKMGDYKLPQLKAEKFLVVLVSTQGEGAPPDNAKELYEFLFSKRAPALKNTQFAVLGLGDSSYEFFCKMGKDFDRRLEELGAQRIHPRVDCDVDYETAAEAWTLGVLDVLATKVTPGAPSISLPGAGLALAPASVYSRKNPFPAVLLSDVVLNGRGSQKETHHIEISLEGSGLTYSPGDALGVYPTNAPDVVADLIKALRFNPDDPVTFDGGRPSRLSEALTTYYEITTITRPVMQKYAALTGQADLQAFFEESAKAKLNAYIDGRELVDLVTDFPAKGVSPQAFVDCLRKLPPRLYSIASSVKAHPDEVHLTVGAVRYQSHGRDRKGVCSTYLADRIGEDSRIMVYVESNDHFKLPADPSRPVIMIGPGTGIAPFRAFMEEREAVGASGKSWLFFGDQHFITDFLYQAEWLRYLKDGLLTRMDVAFSRDQEKKVYVQHRMAEKGKDLFAWLQEGAYVYVCGDAKRMAADVEEALLAVITREGGMSREEASEYLKTMQRENRYQRDVY